MDVREANILVHSRMAAGYNEREPHFRPENRESVRRVLDLFDEIRGVDITPAMLARVPAAANVRVQEADASELPFPAERFDVVTAYSFFHHLQNMAQVAAEAFRVLRPGGALYVDLEPNRHFWEVVLAARSIVDSATSRLARDEVESVCHTDDR